MKKCNVMKYGKIILILLWSIILPVTVFASNENTDTLTVDTLKCHESKNPYRFRPTQLIIPGVVIGAGFIGLESDWLKYTNHETKEELQEHPHSKLGVDDFSQYAPVTAAYGLRLCGVKGLHDYTDLTIIAGNLHNAVPSGNIIHRYRNCIIKLS